MAAPIKLALFLSILLNLVVLALGSMFVAKRGGLQYLIRKIAFWQRAGFNTNSLQNSLFYLDKTSHFETLPQSDSELIFLGDSLTDLCEWTEIFKGNKIKNRGICGDTTDGVLNRLSNIVQSRPQKLFLMIGINDLSQRRKVDDILANYKLILKNLQEQTPQTKVFVQSILPVNNQKTPNHDGVNEKVIAVNTKLEELAKEFSFHYIDLFSSFLDSNHQLDAEYTSDGVHLNGKGYLIWKKIIEESVVN